MVRGSKRISSALKYIRVGIEMLRLFIIGIDDFQVLHFYLSRTDFKGNNGLRFHTSLSHFSTSLVMRLAAVIFRLISSSTVLL